MSRRKFSAAIGFARWAALAVVAGFAVREIIVHWAEFRDTLGGIGWASSVASLGVLIVSVAVSAYGWQSVVDGLGEPVGYRRGARICLVGQLGKYVPGSLWAYLVQMELARRAGLSRARVFTGSLISSGIGMIAAVPVAALAGRGRWPLLALPVVLALHPRVIDRAAALGLRLLRRPRPPRALGARPIVTAFAASLVAWFLQGTHLWLLCGGNPVVCAGAMALAMTVGTFAFLLPSGAGVREAVLVAVLTTAGNPAGQALAFALASRVMFTLADLVTASLAAGTPRRRRSGKPLAGTAARPD